MSDYSDLCAFLRKMAEQEFHDAADAIERMQTEIDNLRHDLERYRDMLRRARRQG